MNNPLPRLLESIQEQSWFQQARAKWDELDPQSRTYLQGAAAVGTALLVGWLFIGSWWKVHSIKSEIADKDEIIHMIRRADDEMHALREQIPSSTSDAEASTQPWNAYFEALAVGLGIDRTSLEVSAETAGTTRELSRETLLTVTLKKVNARQLSRYSFKLENGARPVKIQGLTVETHPDMSGYLDARLTIAAYTLKKSS